MPYRAEHLHALVADPSSHMAGLVTLMLRSLGIKIVDEASSVSAAAAFLTRHPYELMLIDDQFGGEEGFAMVRALRQTADHPNREMPIIMMSSAPDVSLIAAARDAGVNEFLRKPFSAQHIKMRLDGIRNTPRVFVEAGEYVGPDRRRRNAPGSKARRATDAGGKKSA